MAQPPITSIIPQFTRLLTSPWTRAKTPYGFDDAIQRAHLDATEQIFLSVDFRAWLSFFLAQSKRSGRSSNTAVDRTRRLSAEDQREVANQVFAAKPHATVSVAVEKLRKRYTELLGAPSRAVQPAIVPSVESHLRSSSPIMSFAQPEPFYHALQTATTGSSDGNLATSAEISLPLTASTSLEVSELQTQTIENPAAEQLLQIFPIYLCGAISKIGTRARISMVFPYSLDLVCLMGLTIESNKVEYIAMELFGIHLETAGEVRYMILDTGVRVTPGKDLTLSGARPKGIERLLGLSMSQEIDIIRKDEKEKAIPVTHLVTMQISSDARKNAFLNVSLPQTYGLQIRRSLF
ncbi:hypothetical protein AYO20_07357 [Fonsecaea nubica]|uniref:Uncharacterized protein n=1 Tax=Fonsecaea nubica TaxID=856822 RepID=A0A178CV63_9EURO|nr:hypothetical protein AYO20_07357 [Fonsecaea nubica]OAL33346.1 hypothetical protein AYO20_07357 [Fonsecaea nubica]